MGAALSRVIGNDIRFLAPRWHLRFHNFWTNKLWPSWRLHKANSFKGKQLKNIAVRQSTMFLSLVDFHLLNSAFNCRYQWLKESVSMISQALRNSPMWSSIWNNIYTGDMMPNNQISSSYDVIKGLKWLHMFKAINPDQLSESIAVGPGQVVA